MAKISYLKRTSPVEISRSARYISAQRQINRLVVFSYNCYLGFLTGGQNYYTRYKCEPRKLRRFCGVDFVDSKSGPTNKTWGAYSTHLYLRKARKIIKNHPKNKVTVEIHNYCTYYQYTKISDSKSRKQLIDCGVPQGSSLGPLSFLFCVNDLSQMSQPLTTLFADDTLLSLSGANLSRLENGVNTQLQ